MHVVDNILKDKEKHVIRCRDDTLRAGYRAGHGRQEYLITVQLRERVEDLDQEFRNIVRDLALHDRDDLVLLYEEMFDQAWSMLRPSKSRSVMYYPGKAFSYTPGFINHILDQVDIQAHNIEMKKTSGGKGHEHWAVDFELMALKNARSTSRFTPRERKCTLRRSRS